MYQKSSIPFNGTPLRHKLKNGIIVLADPLPHFRSTSLAVSLIGGSRAESLAENGLTHLLEHLLFKRTTTRSTRQIAEKMDEFGGEINAYTDFDSFCLYGTVRNQETESLLRFLSELLLNSDVRDEDVEVEKEIIRQEILEAEDDPSDATYQFFRSKLWQNSSLSRPIFGTTSSVAAFTKEDVQGQLAKLLKGKRLVISAAGGGDPDLLLKTAEELFGHLAPGARPVYDTPPPSSGEAFLPLPSNQTHLVLGLPWPHILDPDYLAGLVLAAILGQGSSSRLFLALREERGLCYDIESSVDAAADVAALVVTASFEEKSLEMAREVLFDELHLLLNDGPTQEEFERAKRMIIAQLEMEADSLAGRLWRMVETEQSLSRYVSAEEVVQRISTLQEMDIRRVAQRSLSKSAALLVLGGDTGEREA